MLTPTLDGAQVRAVIKQLRAIDPESVKTLRSELRSQMSPIAQQIAAAVPQDPPLSGFRNAGATGWSAVKGKVGFTPGKSRNNAKNLISIRVQPDNGRRGIFIAELAGSRSAGSTPQGANLIAVLNSRRAMKGRGGRYAYAQFRFLRPDIVKMAERILNKAFEAIERKIS